MRKHATEDHDAVEHTLCGEPAATSRVDNANPDCKRCLRSIAARIRKARRP